MNTEIKRLWVEALRSGKYVQGKQMLRDGDRFCCLGVLCDLHGDGWNLEDGQFIYHDEKCFLPLEVEKWSEMISGSVLMSLNDAGVPFSVIADYIETNY